MYMYVDVPMCLHLCGYVCVRTCGRACSVVLFWEGWGRGRGNFIDGDYF